MAGVRRLAQRHPSIGDVRGLGLMIGVEFVADRADARARDRSWCTTWCRCAFTKGLLLLGAGRSTLRLAPPLVVTRADIDTGLAIIDECLDRRWREHEQVAGHGPQDTARPVPASSCPCATPLPRYVHDGDTVVIEGFTHLICFAAGHEIIRQHRRDLTLCRLTPDLIYDQMIAAGCARKLVFSWAGNPGAGSLHAFRRAVEGTPDHGGTVEIEEYSHFGMVARLAAGAAGLPFWPLRDYAGTDLPSVNPRIASRSTCPYTGERLATVPALNPDVDDHPRAARRRTRVTPRSGASSASSAKRRSPHGA